MAPIVITLPILIFLFISIQISELDFDERLSLGMASVSKSLTNLKSLSIPPLKEFRAVSYTHLPSPRDRQKSRMPSSA